MISNVVDLNSRCITIAQFRAKHTLKARRCCDKYDFMAIKYFTLHSAKHKCVMKACISSDVVEFLQSFIMWWMLWVYMYVFFYYLSAKWLYDIIQIHIITKLHLPKHNITQLWIIDKFWINTRSVSWL